MEEERFALDNNDNVLDFEDKTDKYCLSQEDVCNLLNKQQKRIAELEKDLEFTTKTANKLIEIKHKLEQELAEKDKEIECLNKRIDRYENMFRSRVNRTGDMQKDIELYINQLAIQELEKVKEEFGLKIGWSSETDMCFDLEQFINQQIKELKGE